MRIATAIRPATRQTTLFIDYPVPWQLFWTKVGDLPHFPRTTRLATKGGDLTVGHEPPFGYSPNNCVNAIAKCRIYFSHVFIIVVGIALVP